MGDYEAFRMDNAVWAYMAVPTVPELATMVLLDLWLAGLTGLRRKFSN